MKGACCDSENVREARCESKHMQEARCESEEVKNAFLTAKQSEKHNTHESSTQDTLKQQLH
eukprot:8425163-Lingulodinium_polyedra.AAC.1